MENNKEFTTFKKYITEGNKKYHPIIEKRINYLVNLGFKNYQLGVIKDMGVYFITLPTTGVTMDQVLYISKGFDPKDVLGHYPHLGSFLCIKTNIPY